MNAENELLDMEENILPMSQLSTSCQSKRDKTLFQSAVKVSGGEPIYALYKQINHSRNVHGTELVNKLKLPGFSNARKIKRGEEFAEESKTKVSPIPNYLGKIIAINFGFIYERKDGDKNNDERITYGYIIPRESMTEKRAPILI
ncbi:MAG: hypothetical protein EZS28_011911 [Streblomastix strix]|uniref:Uncharacterized protein n=1 Tax=Streblomastix strix TaxID=222440 RepID=A0A5J4WCK1_9EUKA|nr:MAG: hypothetical protein EZS28_011911 [Streblomastix strix]